MSTRLRSVVVVAKLLKTQEEHFQDLNSRVGHVLRYSSSEDIVRLQGLEPTHVRIQLELEVRTTLVDVCHQQNMTAWISFLSANRFRG